jgi:hypothetical protein
MEAFSAPACAVHVSARPASFRASANGAKDRERRMQEPPEPDALALALFSDAVHAVVPVACANERKPMPADSQTCIECERAMFEESCSHVKPSAQKSDPFRPLRAARLEKWNQFVEHDRVVASTYRATA